jgi:hypothetical protein
MRGRTAAKDSPGRALCCPTEHGGRVSRSGRGGRRFKSCHSDQLHQQAADKPHLLANIDHLETRQVHKSVHRRVLRMVKLRQDSTGKYIARKRLPDDVREEHGRRHNATRRSSPRLRVTGRTSRSKSFASGMLRSLLASKQSGPSAKAKASRSRDSRREHWLASGITGLSLGTPRLILSNGMQFASECMRRCARR